MMIRDKEVVRRLRGFEKDGDDLVVEVELPSLSLHYLQDLFGLPRDNPMYDAYDVGEKQKVELEKYVEQSINLSKYDYFLE